MVWKLERCAVCQGPRSLSSAYSTLLPLGGRGHLIAACKPPSFHGSQGNPGYALTDSRDLRFPLLSLLALALTGLLPASTRAPHRRKLLVGHPPPPNCGSADRRWPPSSFFLAIASSPGAREPEPGAGHQPSGNTRPCGSCDTQHICCFLLCALASGGHRDGADRRPAAHRHALCQQHVAFHQRGGVGRERPLEAGLEVEHPLLVRADTAVSQVLVPSGRQNISVSAVHRMSAL